MPCTYVNIFHVQYACNLKSVLWVECKCLNMGLKTGFVAEEEVLQQCIAFLCRLPCLRAHFCYLGMWLSTQMFSGILVICVRLFLRV